MRSSSSLPSLRGHSSAPGPLASGGLGVLAPASPPSSPQRGAGAAVRTALAGGGLAVKQDPSAALDQLVRSRRPQAASAHSRAHEYHRQFDVAYEIVAKHRNLLKLDHLFKETDLDGSGYISLDEFQDTLKKPKAQATFSALGIQPHQAFWVFHAFDSNQDGLLSHQEFMTGLFRLCGTDYEGNGQDLDMEVLRAANWAKFEASTSGDGSSEQQRASPLSPSRSQPTLSPQLPDFQLLPRHKLERAFVSSAMSQALHPASAVPKGHKKLALPLF